MNTLLHAIAEHAECTPQKTAVLCGETAYSYAELWSCIRRAATWFRAHAAAGDRVLLNADKSFAYICCYFGAHLAGNTNVVCDPAVTGAYMAALCERLNPALALGWGSTAPWPCPTHPWPAWEELEEYAGDFPAPDTIGDLMFTTGTTGQPKGVPLTQGNLFAAASHINAFIGNTAEDVEMVALPLCHSFGMGRVRCQMLAGGTIIPVPNFGNERLLLESLRNQHVTGVSFVPAAWMYLKSQCGEEFLQAAQGLRYIEIGSAALPLAEKRFLADSLPNTRICMHYGLTEASRSAFMEFHADAAHLDTAGKASPGTEIRIYKDGVQQTTEPGEVCVRGPHVFHGYLGEEQPAFVDGFFRTGDMGRLDEEGYLHLTGRIKELINSGGKKVSPQEVEELLNQHPDIAECACVGLPDEHGVLGEIVAAFVVPAPGVQRVKLMSVRRFLQGKLEEYKMPMKVFMTESLPKTASGKLQRLKLIPSAT